MTRVKICGLRRPVDAKIANTCLPDYVGFVFAASPRQVSPSEAFGIADELDPAIGRVGVFVGAEPEEVAKTVKTVGLDVVQLHFDLKPEYLERLKNALGTDPNRKIEIWQRIAVPVDAQDAQDVINRIVDYPDLSLFDALLFDVLTSKRDGGSGVPFPWEAGKKAARILRVKNPRIIVAGGIGVHNVKRAIEYFTPHTVDVSGSVETNGYKDGEKVAELIRAVREGDIDHE